jgi:hypothetical protein
LRGDADLLSLREFNGAPTLGASDFTPNFHADHAGRHTDRTALHADHKMPESTIRLNVGASWSAGYELAESSTSRGGS